MPISTILTGKLISIGTSFFVVLGSGHYDLNQNVQKQDIAVPATTQITAAMPVNSVPRSTTTSTKTAVSTTPPVTESEPADAFTLIELFEKHLKSRNGDLTRAAVETAKEWRSDKALRQLEAMMIVTDGKKIFLITGVGDVIEAEDDAIAIGSGGNYALSSAKTALKLDKEFNLGLTSKDIARRALEMATSLCIYTNDNYTFEEI